MFETLGPLFTWLWKERKDLAETARRAAPFLGLGGRTADGGGESEEDLPRGDVLLLGAGGVGKTTFARLLTGRPDGSAYEESIGVDTFPLPTDGDGEEAGVEMIVAPGQEQRRDATWADLLAGVEAGRYRGVVLFNAFGHHSIGVPSYRLTRVYRNAGRNLSPAEFSEVFAETRRAQELDVLNRIAAGPPPAGERFWLLSVVTKEDLWFPRADEVRAFYETGPYGEAAADLGAAISSANFRHEVVYCSLKIQRLRDPAGDLLVPNAAGYDPDLQEESFARLLRTLDALRKWEAER